MIKTATISQLESLSDLLQSYKKYSQRYKVSEAKFMAHPGNDKVIYHSIRLKGFKMGDIYDEKKYICIFPDGKQEDCFSQFTESKSRQDFLKELVEAMKGEEESVEQLKVTRIRH